MWKDVKQAWGNQLGGADDHVKTVFIGEPTIGNGEQGASASQLCLFAPLIKRLWDLQNFVAKFQVTKI